MFRLIKINDTSIGHGGCLPAANTILNKNITVFSEDTLVCVAGDQFNPHPNAFCVDHVTTVNPDTCSETVFINGLGVAMENVTTLLCTDNLVLNPINLTKTKVFIGM